MNANQEIIRQVLHPDERAQSSLEDVYVKLVEAEVVLTDLAILAGRHLPLELARVAERALSQVLRLRDAVMPAASDEGPF